MNEDFTLDAVEEPTRRDAREEAAAAALARLFNENRERVFFSRQLEVRNEAEWFHWITNRALRDLIAEGTILSEVRPLATGGRLERPNPNYHDNERVEDLIEDLRLQVASLRGRARDGEAINVESDTFRQFLDHVRRDHGRGVVRGELQDREETEWRSSDGGVVPATRAVQSADAEEIDAADLIAAALDPPAGARPQAEVDPDDLET